MFQTAFLILALQGDSTTNSADIAKVWDSLAKAIRTGYYARAARKTELETRLATYEPKAKSAKSRAEFAVTVRAMIDEFKDSHFDFLIPEDQGYYSMAGLMGGKSAPEMDNVGVWFMGSKSNGWKVQYAFAGTTAYKTGLRKGDTVLTCDGGSFEPVSSLKGKKEVTLKLKRGEKTFDVTLPVTSKKFLDLYSGASRESTQVITRNGKKYGYFKPYVLIDDRIKQALADAVYGKLYNTDGIILDLRDGFGGRPEGFADPFFRPSVDIREFYNGKEENTLHFGYTKPMVVLMNDGTRSAREVLSYVLRKSGRATLVGQNSRGAVLGTAPWKLSSWAYLEMPLVSMKVDGVDLEKRGVKPDVFAPDSFDGDKDLILEKGLEVLANKK